LPSLPRLTLISLVLALAVHPALLAQMASGLGATSASGSTNDAGPAGIIPFVKGPNLSLGSTSQHDSSSGWTSILTPDAAWRFNRHFSADASLPVYTYLNVASNSGTKLKPVYTYATQHHALGDTTLNGHFEAAPQLFSYNFTASLGLPTGNSARGLGAGQVTYAINNHFERAFGFFSPDIEAGIGDSTSLDHTRVRKSYTAVGTLAHFQIGGSFDLPFDMSLAVDAYEELPVGASTIYSTTRRGKRTITSAIGTTASEDNGINTSLDIPVNPHVTLSGFYNRSLRGHDDTAGFSLTFLLRAAPRRESR
jgi:hypothetical protein